MVAAEITGGPVAGGALIGIDKFDGCWAHERMDDMDERLAQVPTC